MMARRISLFLSLLSAALFIATLTFWYRSRHHVDIAIFCLPTGNWQGIAAQHGGVLLFFSNLPGGKDAAWQIQGGSSTADDQKFIDFRDSLFAPPAEKYSIIGFRLASGTLSLTSQINSKYTVIALPYWFLVIVFGVLPMGPFKGAWQRRRRRRRGLCITCGYDIRASSNRCPECGAEIPDPEKIASATSA
jgi:hypothetical protein